MEATKERLLYDFARHIRNTDNLPAPTWAVRGITLLLQLRHIDPEKYDKEVK